MDRPDGEESGDPQWHRLKGKPKNTEWKFHPFSTRSSRPRNPTESPALGDSLPTREAPSQRKIKFAYLIFFP